MFGRPDVAKAGQLNIMAAGEKVAFETVRPLLDVLAKKVWVMGEDPKQANAALQGTDGVARRAQSALGSGDDSLRHGDRGPGLDATRRARLGPVHDAVGRPLIGLTGDGSG